MAKPILPSRPKPYGRVSFPVRSSGSANKQAAALNPHTAHTHSMLSQAARVPRLANLSHVSAMLKAGHGAPRGKK